MLHSKKINKYLHIIEIIIFILTLSILSLNINLTYAVQTKTINYDLMNSII